MTYSKKEVQESKERLLTVLSPDRRIVIMITKVARSGMSRRMKVYTSHESGLSNITYDVARACELSLNDDGVLVGGCGMDMAFWLADHLTWRLWGEKAKDMAFKGNGGGCLDWQAIY